MKTILIRMLMSLSLWGVMAQAPAMAEDLSAFKPFGIELGQPFKDQDLVIKREEHLKYDRLLLKELPMSLSFLSKECATDKIQINDWGARDTSGKYGCRISILVSRKHKLVYQVQVQARNVSINAPRYMVDFIQALMQKYPDLACRESASSGTLIDPSHCLKEFGEEFLVAEIEHGPLYIQLATKRQDRIGLYIDDSSILENDLKTNTFEDKGAF